MADTSPDTKETVIKPAQKSRLLEETHIDELLHLTVKQKASALHIAVGLPPVLRVHGKLLQAPYTVFTPTIAQRMVYEILTDEDRQTFESTYELDFQYSLGRTSDFHVNIFRERGRVAAAFRAIPRNPTLEELNLPPIIEKLTHITRGLILVGGPMVSGKATTLAAMIDAINRTRSEHIMVITTHMEWIYRHAMSMIHQREIGCDSLSVSAALESVIKEAPDVILLPGLRTIEMMRFAITYTEAEPGHLVLAPISTCSAAWTVERVIESFPLNEQPMIRQQLADNLQAVICQQMVPMAEGNGRVCAQEIMIVTPEIRDLIRRGEFDRINLILQTSAHLGMQTMDQSLFEFYRTGKIIRDRALAHSMNRSNMGAMIEQHESDSAG